MSVSAIRFRGLVSSLAKGMKPYSLKGSLDPSFPIPWVYGDLRPPHCNLNINYTLAVIRLNFDLYFAFYSVMFQKKKKM